MNRNSSTRWFFVVLLMAWAQHLWAEPEKNPDPFEKVNRAVFEFNRTLDKYMLKPVASGYSNITPPFVRSRFNTVFSNVSDVPTTANSVLQGKFKKAGKTVLRIGINATLGFFGMFDVASDLGIKQDKEDFGQTLAVWGVPEGPYIVVPFFGVYTVRSGAGAIVDIYFDPIFVNNVADRNALFAFRTIDKRAELLDVEGLVIGDPYLFIRNLYLQQSQYEAVDGKVEDDFGADDFEDEDDWLDDEEADFPSADE